MMTTHNRDRCADDNSVTAMNGDVRIDNHDRQYSVMTMDNNDSHDRRDYYFGVVNGNYCLWCDLARSTAMAIDMTILATNMTYQLD
jgi:hypothetical protein